MLSTAVKSVEPDVHHVEPDIHHNGELARCFLRLTNLSNYDKNEGNV